MIPRVYVSFVFYVRSLCPEYFFWKLNTSPAGLWALIVFIALFHCTIPSQVISGDMSVSAFVSRVLHDVMIDDKDSE